MKVKIAPGTNGVQGASAYHGYAHGVYFQDCDGRWLFVYDDVQALSAVPSPGAIPCGADPRRPFRGTITLDFS